MGKWRERLRFRRWGKWILIGGVGFVVLGTVSVEVTSQSFFCNSCHIMEPYYESWKHGSHKDVACVECHISPGVQNFVAAKLNGAGQVVDDILNRTSHKPSASVDALSCTRSGCHTVETLNKKEIRTDKFKFRHDRHLGKKHLGVEITCGTCHSHNRGEEHFSVSTNVCITCHLVGTEPDSREVIAGGQATIIRLVARDPLTGAGAPTLDMTPEDKIPPDNCTACHDPPEGEIEFQGIKFDHSRFLSFGASCESCHRGVTATPPPIDDGRCLECHVFGVERAIDPIEMHRVHTLGKHKIECTSCHGWVRHGARVQVASMEQFECTHCHADQHAIQRRNYFSVDAHAQVADDKGNPMFLAHVDCTGCHIAPRPPSEDAEPGAMVLVATPESCDRCHQPGYGAQMIPLWQNATRKLFEQVQVDLAALSRSSPDSPAIAEVRAILDEISHDGSWGVHNPRRTQQMLEDARARLAAPAPAGEAAPEPAL